LLFTALNNQFWSTDLAKPMASLPVVIFQFAMSPTAIGTGSPGPGTVIHGTRARLSIAAEFSNRQGGVEAWYGRPDKVEGRYQRTFPFITARTKALKDVTLPINDAR